MKHALDDIPNPIRGTSSKDRLTDIGHFFLSNEDERATHWRNTLVVPTLLISRLHDFVAYELAKAIEKQNKQCLVLNVESRDGQGVAPVSQPTEAPDVCLIPLTSTRTTLALQGDKLLLAIPASLPGVRLAYNHLAQLASLGQDMVINAIMVEADDEKSAMRYFRFLCNSARDFLALEIKCGGIILHDAHKGSTNDASKEKDSVPVGIQAIAEAVIKKKRLSSPEAPKGSPIPALSLS
jgi:hypothetical protein